MKNPILVRLLTVVTIVVLACTALAEQPEKPPKGQAKYLIVLWHPGTPVPGKKEERMKKVPEPDVAKLGGRVLASQANRRVVFLPYGVAKKLRKHAAVSYIQRIWTGEDFSEWNEIDTAASRPERIASNSEQFTWSKDYTYDADGNITHVGSAASGYDEFAYDGVGRLTEAVVNGAPETYFYDAFGNLTGFGRPTGGRAIPVDPATNRLVGANYDAAGNITTREERGEYAYDPLNMIVEYETTLGDPRRILYDANDERIGMTDGLTTQRWTIRDFDGQVLREFKGDQLGVGMMWWWEQDHIRGEGQLIAGEMQTWSYSPDEENPSQFTYGGKRHYHLDHLGSVRIVTNQAGKAIAENDFFPFGAARTKQYQEQLNEGDPHTDGMRFAGHWRDFMGHPNVEGDDYLDYMHARYYDPHLGRFLSVDPAWESADLARPQTWNRYVYAENNPMRLTDPDGRYAVALAGAARAVAEAAADRLAEQVVIQAARTAIVTGAIALGIASEEASETEEGAPTGDEPPGLLGAEGQQVDSKTLWSGDGARVDVENPAPGRRAGQVQIQRGKGEQKETYMIQRHFDQEAKRWGYRIADKAGNGAPNWVKNLMKDAAVRDAIYKGMVRYLNESGFTLTRLHR